ncbi:fibroblast growth factor 21 [Pelobates cultripes]|uniref:Fibroblast growth factor 21 n=1 Tax=Pelobates cultripes TaxID=61616 RepID=A0AAD1WQR2_PELCU|nr:fibroblast growth factor 21 [Pelobates cultripes]
MMKAGGITLVQSPLLRWCLLLAFILIFSRTVLASPLRDTNPLLQFSDQVRLRYLYADNEHTHLHLQISPEGKVSGTREKNVYSLLEIKAVKPSILVIRGTHSTMYLCMNSKHHLYGSAVYNENDCNFREVPLHDGYNLYFSEKHPAHLKLTPVRGRQLERFIPLEASSESTYMGDYSSEHFQRPKLDIGSEDPLGMIDTSNIFSPSSDS